MYQDELRDAERQGLAAYTALEAWVSRPADAPEVSGAILEGYARALRASRERIRELLSQHGERDDIAAALATSETYHLSLGLSIKDKPELEPEPE